MRPIYNANGVNCNILITNGDGVTAPVASNDKEKGRALNR